MCEPHIFILVYGSMTGKGYVPIISNYYQISTNNIFLLFLIKS